MYHLPFETPNDDKPLPALPLATNFKLPSEKTDVPAVGKRGLNVAKLLVQVSVVWSIAS
jgi:hypothetical protein